MAHTIKGAIVIAAVVLLLVATMRAQSRDSGQYAQTPPEIRQWFNSLRSGKGNCCSMADGRSISDADTDIRGDHFWVRVDGEWIEVPDEALVNQPNRIGQPVVWPMKDADGKTAVRCFLPGAGA